MDALIVIPPFTTGCEPEPGALALSGYLNARGHRAEVYDANIKLQLELLQAERLGQAALKLAGDGGRAGIDAQRMVRRTLKALDDLRDPAIYTHRERYRNAVNSFADGLRASGKALGVRLTPGDFDQPGLSPLCSDDLARVASDPGLLGTRAPMEVLVGELVDANPAVIGISLTYISQALHSFALAGLLRQLGFTGKLILGGALISSWADRLKPASAFFDVWDCVVFGEGEELLAEMISRNKIPDSEGILAPKRKIWNPTQATVGREVGFSPDLDSPPWSDYLSPGGIVAVAASRGCYWARCAFCPEAEEDHCYKAGPVEKLADDLIRLRDDYGVSRVHFTDNALSPAHLRRLARKLKGEGIGWYGFSRVEKKLAEPGFMEELKSGGCEMLQLGIESASPRLLELMGKGATPALADRVLTRAAQAGVRIFGYFLFGSPTETEAEARLTMEWIRERADRIDFINLALMNLPRAGEMEKDPERFGVESLKTLDAKNDLTLYWGFDGGATVDRRTLRRMLAELKKDPAVRPLISRTPRWFKSKHAAFSPR